MDKQDVAAEVERDFEGAALELESKMRELTIGTITDDLFERVEIKPERKKGSEPGRDDWMTPGWLAQLAREVMGEIDLDPCSTDEANMTIQAKDYYTKDMNGLADSNPWFGKVFMNPPYSRGVIDQFTDKLCANYQFGRVTEAFVITNNVTETTWAHKLLKSMSSLCLMRGRIHFVKPGGEVARETRQGQIVWYLGDRSYKFEEVMRDYGVILTRR